MMYPVPSHARTVVHQVPVAVGAAPAADLAVLEGLFRVVDGQVTLHTTYRAYSFMRKAQIFLLLRDNYH